MADGYGAFSSYTIADVKAYHGYGDTDKDAQLTLLLDMVADEITAYCHNDFLLKERVNEEPIIPRGRDTFFTKYRPVSAVDSITLDDVLLDTSTYYLHKNTGAIEKVNHSNSYIGGHDGWGGYWSTVRGDIKITYTGGVTLPSDVLMVFYEKIGVRAGIKQKTYIDNEGIEQVVILKTISPELKGVLDRHMLQNFFPNGSNS